MGVKSEKRFLCYEANQLLLALRKMKQVYDKRTVIVSNQSYGLVPIAPIRHILQKEKFRMTSTKVGSTESHNAPFILKPNMFTGLEDLLFDEQPLFVIIDGTRNVDGSNPANNKYPDSQQAFLNYVVTFNDSISQGNYSSYANLVNVSFNHVRNLRNKFEYHKLRSKFDEQLKDSNPELYGFQYWNPAGLEFSLYNASSCCQSKVKSCDISKLDSPNFIFINAVIPNERIPLRYKMQYGEHTPAYFDDNDDFSTAELIYTDKGFSVKSGFYGSIMKMYDEMFGDKDD